MQQHIREHGDRLRLAYRKRHAWMLGAVLASGPFAGHAQPAANLDWANLAKYAAEDAVLEQTQPAAPRVVLFGDSLTERWGAKNEQGVSDTGTYLADHGYINRGISGQTTQQMLVRFRQDVLRLKPAVLVLLAGTNDIAGNTGPMTNEQIEGDLQSLVELAQRQRIRIVLCTLPPVTRMFWAPAIHPAERILQVNAWIRQYAREQDLTLVDYYPALVDAASGMTAAYTVDGAHPNKAGYAVMQPLLQAGIDRALSRRVPPAP